jgi:hypothetical protein
MVVARSLVVASIGLFCSSSFASALSWNATEYMFVFGDSYTTDGYNVSAGINSPVPGDVSICTVFRPFPGLTSYHQTSSNGQNWVQFLSE